MSNQYFILTTVDGKFVAPDGTLVTDKGKAATVRYDTGSNSLTLTDNMIGPLSLEKTCENAGNWCSGNGYCKNLKCQCNAGWSGDDCSVPNSSGGDGGSSSGMSAGTIIAIIIGVIIGIAVIAFVIYLIYTHEGKSDSNSNWTNTERSDEGIEMGDVRVRSPKNTWTDIKRGDNDGLELGKIHGRGPPTEMKSINGKTPSNVHNKGTASKGVEIKSINVRTPSNVHNKGTTPGNIHNNNGTAMRSTTTSYHNKTPYHNKTAKRFTTLSDITE